MFQTQQLEEALAELEREQAVRETIFPRWIKEGRIARCDVEIRRTRLRCAIEVVRQHLDLAATVDEATAEEEVS